MFIETLEFTIPVDLCDLFISLKKGVNSNVEFPASVNSYGTTQDANIQVVMRSNKLTFKVDGVSSNASLVSKSECKTLKLSVFDVDCSLLNENESVVEHEVSMISDPITHSVLHFSHASKRPRKRLSSGKHNAKVARTSLSETSTPSHISRENSQSSSETDSRLHAEQVNVKKEPGIIEIEHEQYEDSKPSVQDLQRSQEALDRLSHPQSTNSSIHQNVSHAPDYTEAGSSQSWKGGDYVIYQQSGNHGDDDYGDNNDNSADFGNDGGTTGPPSTATTTTPTASTSTATSASASLPKKPRSSGFLSEEDEEKMIEWLQENRFLYNRKSKQYKDKSRKTKAWQTQADNLGFEVRCLLTWYGSVRTRYGKLVARPSGSGAQLTDREKWILDNLDFLKPYIHRKTPVNLKGKLSVATTKTGDDTASSIAEESTQAMQQRHDEDIADINMVLEGREDPVAHIATPTTTSPEQAPPSSTGGKKTHTQKMEQDAAFFSYIKESADATAQFRADIMAASVAPKKLFSGRSGFCNWFESVAESVHPSLWPSFKKKITPILVSFDEQNDNLQMPSTLQSN